MRINNKYFIGNTIVGAFFAITNGGASIMMLAASRQWSNSQIFEAALLSLFGLFIVIIGIAAIIKLISESRALKLQFLMILFLVSFLTIWGITILAQSTIQEMQVSWLAGFLTGLATYVYLLAKQVKDSQAAEFISSHWAPLLVIIFGIDCSLFFKISNSF